MPDLAARASQTPRSRSFAPYTSPAAPYTSPAAPYTSPAAPYTSPAARAHASVRAIPSSNATAGSQPSSSRARVFG